MAWGTTSYSKASQPGGCIRLMSRSLVKARPNFGFSLTVERFVSDEIGIGV